MDNFSDDVPLTIPGDQFHVEKQTTIWENGYFLDNPYYSEAYAVDHIVRDNCHGFFFKFAASQYIHLSIDKACGTFYHIPTSSFFNVGIKQVIEDVNAYVTWSKMNMHGWLRSSRKSKTVLEIHSP